MACAISLWIFLGKITHHLPWGKWPMGKLGESQIPHGWFSTVGPLVAGSPPFLWRTLESRGFGHAKMRTTGLASIASLLAGRRRALLEKGQQLTLGMDAWLSMCIYIYIYIHISVYNKIYIYIDTHMYIWYICIYWIYWIAFTTNHFPNNHCKSWKSNGLESSGQHGHHGSLGPPSMVARSPQKLTPPEGRWTNSNQSSPSPWEMARRSSSLPNTPGQPLWPSQTLLKTNLWNQKNSSCSFQAHDFRDISSRYFSWLSVGRVVLSTARAPHPYFASEIAPWAVVSPAQTPSLAGITWCSLGFGESVRAKFIANKGSSQKSKSLRMGLYSTGLEIVWQNLKIGNAFKYRFVTGEPMINQWIWGYPIFRQTHMTESTEGLQPLEQGIWPYIPTLSNTYLQATSLVTSCCFQSTIPETNFRDIPTTAAVTMGSNGFVWHMTWHWKQSRISKKSSRFWGSI